MMGLASSIGIRAARRYKGMYMVTNMLRDYPMKQDHGSKVVHQAFQRQKRAHALRSD
jgi:hypothetical protein